MTHPLTHDDQVDPDPFSIGITLFAAMVTGASFIETRRQTGLLQRNRREAFRAAWYGARRSVLFFEHALDEFETHVLQDGYGARSFQVGTVRLVLSRSRADELRMLHDEALTAARHLRDRLSTLSDFLGPDDQDPVTTILTEVAGLPAMPARFADVVTQGRTVAGMYHDLLADLAARHGFEEVAASA
ncbi:MAG: hypothetical protein QOE45_339 [Frankiaceae bacterium]|jgi:hypothetical protein|nr:hypothetical protein [Frankiaceae bacterium]